MLRPRLGALAAGCVATAAITAGLLLVLAAPAARAHVSDGATNVVATISDSRLTLAPDTVPVGSVVFRVLNRGKVARDFRIGGRRTAKIAAGKSAILNVSLTTRGPQAYTSVGQGQSGRLSGVLNVIEPCTKPVTTTVSVQMAQGQGGLTLSQTTVPCGTVTFVVSNTGTLVDRLDVFEAELAQAQGSTAQLYPGQTASLTINFAVKGTVYCQSGDYPYAEPELHFDFSERGWLTIA